MGAQGDGCVPKQQTSQSSYIKVPVGGRLSIILVDTGASHSFISKHIFDNEFQKFFNLFTCEKKSIIVANKTPMYSEGYVEMEIGIGSIKTTAKLWVMENLCTGIILGLDWLTSDNHKASINLYTNSLSISSNEKQSSVPLSEINMNQQHRVRICDKFILNPMEERIIEVKITDLPNNYTAQFTPTCSLLHQDSILMPHDLINVKNHRALMTMMNISNRPKMTNRNTPIGVIEIESPNSSCFFISSFATTPSSLQPQSNDNDNNGNANISIQVKKLLAQSLWD